MQTMTDPKRMTDAEIEALVEGVTSEVAGDVEELTTEQAREIVWRVARRLQDLSSEQMS